jgi:hypothetical protein
VARFVGISCPELSPQLVHLQARNLARKTKKKASTKIKKY